MCDDHQKMTGKLYGIGIGPGDPGLLTLKAKEVLNKVETIFVPKSREDGISCARSIIAGVISREKKFIEITFPMTRDKKKLRVSWREAAEKIASEFKRSKEAAFVTLGDPFIYSTYIYLFQTLRRDFPRVEIETIPGISSFNAAASRLGLPLVEGDEKLAIVPVTHDLRGLKETLKSFDTVVLMKVAAKLAKVIKLLTKMKLLKNARLISRAGQPGEEIIRDLALIKDEKPGYLSVVIVKKGAKK